MIGLLAASLMQLADMYCVNVRHGMVYQTLHEGGLTAWCQVNLAQDVPQSFRNSLTKCPFAASVGQPADICI